MKGRGVIAARDALAVAFGIPRGGIDLIGHGACERLAAVGEDRAQPEDARAKVEICSSSRPA